MHMQFVAHACNLAGMTLLLICSPSPTQPTLGRRLWAALIVLCGVLFLDGLDVSMVGVALPSIREDLGLSTSAAAVDRQRLRPRLRRPAAPRRPRRRPARPAPGLLTALAVFAVASLLGGLVSDGTLLIATRFIKGVSAAFTAPAGLSIITTTFAEGPARNRALEHLHRLRRQRLLVGLVLGGLLTEAGWRWTFLLPVPFALALLVAAPRVLGQGRAVAPGGGAATTSPAP